MKIQLRVKELIAEKGITQKELAKLTGLREATVSDITRGTRTGVNFEHLAKIAEALNINDISEIIELEK